MWEILQSWPVALLGTIAVGVGTNLVTPTIGRYAGNINTKRRASAVNKLLLSYNKSVDLALNEILLFEFIRRQFASLAYLIIYASGSVLFSLQADKLLYSNDTRKCLIYLDICEALKPYQVAIFFISFILLGGICLNQTLKQQYKSAQIYKFAANPDRYRSQILKKILVFDSNFQESKLIKMDASQKATKSALDA